MEGVRGEREGVRREGEGIRREGGREGYEEREKRKDRRGRGRRRKRKALRNGRKLEQPFLLFSGGVDSGHTYESR